MKRVVGVFGASLVFRLIAIGYLTHVKPTMLVWGTNEAGGIARWIITAHSFSSPFHDAHGPTAWLAPIYPLIISGVFLVFGIQTYASALATVAFNCVCSAATGVVVYKIGQEVESERAGLYAGWMWALSPYLAIIPFLLWDTALSALALGIALLQTLRLQLRHSESWGICGLSWGTAALVNPALLMPLPVLALFLSERGKKWKPVLIMLLFTVVLILPWTIRNYLAFHKIFPIRSNGFAEVYFANASFETHPLGPSMEYQRMGEGAFTAKTTNRALKLIEDAPLIFLRNCLRRAFWFWIYPLNYWPLSVAIDLTALAGLIVVFRKSRLLALTLLAVVAVYPLVYYPSQVVSRYRHPIEPVLYALSGVAISNIPRTQRLNLRLGRRR